MEASVATIIIVLVVIWYLGNSINSILSGSGELAANEFGNFKREQAIRLHKERIKQAKAVNKFDGQPVYSDAEFEAIFAVHKEDQEEELEDKR